MLADENRAADPGISLVLWFPHDSEVRLLEVSTSLADTGEALPFRFAKSLPEVPCECVVVGVGHGDLERLEDGDMELPLGWLLHECVRL